LHSFLSGVSSPTGTQLLGDTLKTAVFAIWRAVARQQEHAGKLSASHAEFTPKNLEHHAQVCPVF